MTGSLHEVYIFIKAVSIRTVTYEYLHAIRTVTYEYLRAIRTALSTNTFVFIYWASSTADSYAGAESVW